MDRHNAIHPSIQSETPHKKKKPPTMSRLDQVLFAAIPVLPCYQCLWCRIGQFCQIVFLTLSAVWKVRLPVPYPLDWWDGGGGKGVSPLSVLKMQVSTSIISNICWSLEIGRCVLVPGKKYPETGGYLVMGYREGRACQEGCGTGAQGEKKSKVGSKYVNIKLNLIDIRALEM